MIHKIRKARTSLIVYGACWIRTLHNFPGHFTFTFDTTYSTLASVVLWKSIAHKNYIKHILMTKTYRLRLILGAFK